MDNPDHNDYNQIEILDFVKYVTSGSGLRPVNNYLSGFYHYF
jgi:hypothetical protein